MKKTLISLVLVFALLSTCVFSAVFAAYSASATKTITATVSAFGIDSITVTAADIPLAPGGSGVLATAAVTGTPQVGVAITYSADLAFAADSFEIAADELYCPIIFIVNSVEYKIGGTYKPDPEGEDITIDTLTKLEDAVEWAVSKIPAQNYEKNVTVNYTNDNILSWKWDTASDNTKDKQLDNTDKFTLAVTATVTQR